MQCHYPTMTDSWEYEKLVENQDDLARAMGANKGIALSVATKLVAKKVVSEAAKELADVRGPDVTERLRATSVINIVLEEIKADPTVYYVFREALLSAGLTNGVVNKWMPAKPGNSEPTTTSTEGTTGAGSGAGNSEPPTPPTAVARSAGSGADQGRHSRKCEVVIVFILVITIPVICGVAYKAYHAAGSQEILENDSRILENDPEMDTVGCTRIQDVQQVFRAIENDIADWKRLGEELQISQVVLERIDAEQRGEENKLRKMIQVWSKNTPAEQFCWNKLIMALELMKEKRLAQTISKDYMKCYSEKCT